MHYTCTLYTHYNHYNTHSIFHTISPPLWYDDGDDDDDDSSHCYMQDVLLAVALKQAGDEQVSQFEQEIIKRPTGLSKSMREFFDSVLERAPSAPSGSASSVAGLAPCALSKFQVMDVPAYGSIEEFVNSQPGLAFKAGQGYYEFTKAEEISDKKNIVLMSSDGTLYEGSAARSIAGIPSGATKKIKPGDVPGYTVFVQSTSYNRELIGGTRFLYQVSQSTHCDYVYLLNVLLPL